MAHPPPKVFFSYSHNDEPLKNELIKHLSILKRQGVISIWHDRQIPPGTEWDQQINEHLETAEIILLLVSADFIASDYCWGVEVTKAIARHEAGDACVIPIILRSTPWESAPFARLQALPKNAKAVMSWKSQDDAFTDIAKGIQVVAQKLITERQQKLAQEKKEAAIAQYRQKVEEFAADGEISQIEAHILLEEQKKLGLTDAEANNVREQVLEPYGIYKENLDKYRQIFTQLVEQQGYPLKDKDQADLKKLQVYYRLKDEDIARINHEQESIEQQNQQRLRQEQAIVEPARQPANVVENPINKSSHPSIQTQPFEFDIATITIKSSGILGLGKTCEVNLRRAKAEIFQEALGNGVNLEIVAIPGGKFLMGSPESEAGYHESQSPHHPVTIQPFFMGKFTVTQAQWAVVASWNKVKIDLDPDPSNFKGAKRPVESVSWDQAVEFCDRLSKKTNKHYRLPSEAEWEYACRAGTTTPFHFGETITTEVANYNGEYTYGSGSKGKYREQTTDVGEFFANPFGLYDLHGNVWEWCQDAWHKNYNGAPNDGSAWISDNEYRLLRGGSRYSDPGYCRSAYRYRLTRDAGYADVGFRVVVSRLRT